LQTFGHGVFAGYVADQSAYFRSEDLEAVLYPNALLLRGPSGVAARAHALAVEALTGHPDMFQTASSEAQEIERQIQRVWSAYRLNPQAHQNAPSLLSRFEEIATEIARRPCPSTTGTSSTGRCSSSAAPSAAGGRSSR
jgi:hypothetical protein